MDLLLPRRPARKCANSEPGVWPNILLNSRPKTEKAFAGDTDSFLAFFRPVGRPRWLQEERAESVWSHRMAVNNSAIMGSVRSGVRFTFERQRYRQSQVMLWVI